ncbi:cytochrome P450 [Aspergillus pseudocaelatus]|uniref:Cytochrome P450 n=1 Tax=Aspergillus pseudocaelatus TaxID=1825620 RepID=A0ABQ6WBF0_9EURO|nr:cytochrome P450 [Aspergillus pseudocaelatus]
MSCDVQLSSSPSLKVDLLVLCCVTMASQSLVFLFVLSLPFCFSYFVSWILYHWANRPNPNGVSEIPPSLPAAIPVLGHTIPFLFDSVSFVRRATSYAGRLTCVRISLPLAGIYLFQEPEAVAALWKHPLLSSPIYIYTVGLRYLFGMKEDQIETYTADDSGPYRKPHPNSNVLQHNRVDYLTHDSLLRGLSGAGLTPTFQRCQGIITSQISSLSIEDEWIQMPDLLQFFRDHVGRAVLQSLFGPLLLSVNPTFMECLWEFDAATPYLAKRLPRWLVPSAYRVRESLLDQIQNWYRHARVHFHGSLIAEDGDGDPCWGSRMMRERQEFLLAVDRQDDASLASTDLGLIWTSITNVVPTAMMAVFHIFQDPTLLYRVRESIQDHDVVSFEPELAVSMDKLLQNDLLQAVYAETLRLYVQAYVTRCSAHEPASVGRWWLGQNDVVMVSSYVNHMHEQLWNTKDGAYPVNTFWADRFLLHPADPRSGPRRTWRDQVDPYHHVNGVGSQPSFSMKGLEGMWIPYGGGTSACPGRNFAKRLILFTCAFFVSQFDVDIQVSSLDMDSSTFGLGTQKPKHKVPFAIRRRTNP